MEDDKAKRLAEALANKKLYHLITVLFFLLLKHEIFTIEEIEKYCE